MKKIGHVHYLMKLYLLHRVIEKRKNINKVRTPIYVKWVWFRSPFGNRNSLKWTLIREITGNILRKWIWHNMMFSMLDYHLHKNGISLFSESLCTFSVNFLCCFVFVIGRTYITYMYISNRTFDSWPFKFCVRQFFCMMFFFAETERSGIFNFPRI